MEHRSLLKLSTKSPLIYILVMLFGLFGTVSCGTLKDWGDQIDKENRNPFGRKNPNSERGKKTASQDGSKKKTGSKMTLEERAEHALAGGDKVEQKRSSIQRRQRRKISREIFFGMSMGSVRQVWGLPDRVQIAGDVAATGGSFERWIYYPTLYETSTRVVYFENGHVSAWERR